jgi:adenine-specific DNA-methyltransferase
MVAVVSLRYMGTKKALAPVVREAVKEVRRPGQVADLFSGMGSVASSLASVSPVLTNDALAFTTTFASARFLDGERMPGCRMARLLFPDFRTAYEHLRDEFGHRIARERIALASATRDALAVYMESAPHVANSDWYRRRRREAVEATSHERYCMTVLYFAAGYFSTAQAAQLDAIRFAIDGHEDAASRGWLMAAWLAAAGVVMNAPGHAAQYLKPGNDEVFKRIRRQWQRPVWPIFIDKLEAIQAVGTRTWRSRNTVCNADALELVKSRDFDSVGTVYADPPYTRDHYSRFYHVYETLYLYDFPESQGAGRYRPDRFSTPFSLARDVDEAFRQLFASIAKRGLPLVLSYPDNGLLHRNGRHVTDLLQEHFAIKQTHIGRIDILRTERSSLVPKLTLVHQTTSWGIPVSFSTPSAIFIISERVTMIRR